MIELKNISLYYYPREEFVLRDISWHIRPGERWVLFGRNGSGKTRLLEIITGYSCSSGGSVFRFGGSGPGQDLRELRKRIGYISGNLRESFGGAERVLDVVLSGLYASIGLYEEPGAGDVCRGRELLALSGLGGRERDPFGVLSDGEKQKVMFLRALIGDPELMILDEPSRGLDLAAREDLLFTVGSLSRERDLPLLYVTHHTEEITPLFNRIFLLHRGGCLFQGEIREGLTAERLSVLFGREVRVQEHEGRYYTLLGL